MKTHMKLYLHRKASIFAVFAFLILMGMNSCSSGTGKTPDNSASATGDNTATNSSTFDSATDKGIGPISSVNIGAINSDSAAKGETLFKSKCSACHKLDERLVGPPLRSVTSRRTPEWIMNQILNPEEQDKKDPIGQALLAKYMTQMTFQSVSQSETRDILEYLRSVNPSRK